MLRSMSDLQGFTIHATDGDIGKVHDFYFDDENWTVRYLVVETGGWLGSKVLVSPIAMSKVDWSGSSVETSLTRDQIRNSPTADLHRPVSRQFETQYYSYFGYGPYWGGPGAWGSGAMPSALAGGYPLPAHPAAPGGTPGAPIPPEDSHLHSSREVLGYHIEAVDGDIGHIDDFLIDDSSWSIRYMQVDTSNWIGGKPVLVPRSALDSVNWLDGKVHVTMGREQIKNSPRFDKSRVQEDDERRLGEYYGAQEI